jgi:predicted amidohydrolase YtcJ
LAHRTGGYDPLVQVDTLIVNGRLFGAQGDALAIAGGRIAAVGSGAAMAALRRSPTEVIDARGGLVIPGFNDAHMHLRHGGLALAQLDLFGITELDEIQRRIAAYAAERHDPWILGRGWFYAAFGGGLPTREQLDVVVPDRPAYFACFDSHSGWANTRALAAAGIDEHTPDPPGGEIVRDSEGRPTGALKERATELVMEQLPPLPDDELEEVILRALEALARAGITAAQDAWATEADFKLVRRLHERSALPIRLRMAPELSPGALDSVIEQLASFTAFDERPAGSLEPRGGIIKSFLDGVIEARTAYLVDPYPGTDSRGQPRWTDEQLRVAVGECHRRGWQLELHAVGDAAVRQALDAYEALGRGEAARRRHRIEHIEIITDQDLPRFSQLGVVASMQPMHAVPETEQADTWRNVLAPAVAATGWRTASLIHSGARVSFGSDWPVVPHDPFMTLHAALHRQSPEGVPAGGWNPAEKVSLSQALSCATYGSAFAEHAERERGRLTEGMLADVAVLDRDLFAQDGAAVLDTTVRLTMVGGRVTHRTD